MGQKHRLKKPEKRKKSHEIQKKFTMNGEKHLKNRTDGRKK